MIRSLAFVVILLAAVVGATATATAQNAPGVTATGIKIGQTMPYSGPVSAFGTLGKGEIAYFNMINDQGGVNGRKITLISLDDGYAPPKTVEQTRKLVEQDEVALIFSTIGTATNTAITKYLNDRRVPHLFIGSGAHKWGDYKAHPWTMGGVQATFRSEARIYTKYILEHNKNAKIALLYQNDDFGRDYMNGVKDALGDRYAAVVKEATYEYTDPTIDSQVVMLQATGADALIVGATPKFAAMAIRRVYDLGWKPMFFLSNVSIWVSTVMEPAGVEKGIGIMSSAYVKDPTDPTWNNDPAMKEWRVFMQKYAKDADIRDQNYINSYNSAMTLVHVLKQCGNDLSRENILRQATRISNLDLPMLLPGIKLNTSPTDYFPIEQMQLMRWSGKQWIRFGELLEASR